MARLRNRQLPWLRLLLMSSHTRIKFQPGERDLGKFFAKSYDGEKGYHLAKGLLLIVALASIQIGSNTGKAVQHFQALI